MDLDETISNSNNMHYNYGGTMVVQPDRNQNIQYSKYSQFSISRTRISRIRRNSKCLSESKIHFDCFLQPLFGVEDFFTSSNYPKCKLIVKNSPYSPAADKDILAEACLELYTKCFDGFW